MDKNNENLIYLETYRGIDIYQCKDIKGAFCFYLEGKHIYFNLSKAKEAILAIANFTHTDYNNLLSKLDDKEKKFVTTIIEELQHHMNSSWCDVDIDLPYYIDNF